MQRKTRGNMIRQDTGHGAGVDGNPVATAEHQAYHLVKTRVMEMYYKPGQYVPDSDLAEELALSRTPIANALRRLEYEGLLTNQPRRGWQVTPLSLDDIHEIFSIKEALETMIARQAAASTDEALRAILRDCVEKMQHLSAAGDKEAWDIVHMRWHQTVLAMSEYPDGRVPRILNNLNDQWRRVRRGLLAIDGRMARETIEHVAIAESILSQDLDEAEQRTLRHLQHVRQEVVNLLANMVLPFATNGI
jgi:GntR family transcriptional regulator, rspAB operon transcriptional repressor